MVNYYTLTDKGRAWVDDEARGPAKHKKVLAALAEQILENDVPRTAEQIARAAGIELTQGAEGLSYLASASYVKTSRLPQPIERGETPKSRIRPIEELAAAEARAAEARKRYNGSEKGKASHRKYEDSDKGVEKNIRYWSDPEKGRKVQKAYRLRRRLKELTAHLKKHPKLKSLIQPDIEKAERQLQELEGGK